MSDLGKLNRIQGDSQKTMDTGQLSETNLRSGTTYDHSETQVHELEVQFSRVLFYAVWMIEDREQVTKCSGNHMKV